MFHDLHVLWQGQVAETSQTLHFLHELGYNTVALSHVLSGKLPSDLSCAIPSPLPFEVPATLKVLRRCDLTLSDPSQNHRLQQLSANYDLLALRPTNDKALLQACHSLECDIISLDLTVRLDAHLKMKALAQAIERGVKFEICYAPGLSSSDGAARRNLISNATQLIRATRGRGLILSSEAHRAITCRAPADVINLAAVWGLGPERGKDGLDKLARSVVVSAELKRASYRGAVQITSPALKDESGKAPKNAQTRGNSTSGSKRGAAELEDASEEQSDQHLVPPTAAPLSKRAMKRRKKAALLASPGITSSSALSGSGSEEP